MQYQFLFGGKKKNPTQLPLQDKVLLRSQQQTILRGETKRAEILKLILKEEMSTGMFFFKKNSLPQNK